MEGEGKERAGQVRNVSRENGKGTGQRERVYREISRREWSGKEDTEEVQRGIL